MEIKVLLCNCKGLCASFEAADMNRLPFVIESELDVRYTVLHPQLCGPGGNAVLADAMMNSGPDTYLVVGACAPDAQMKLFRKTMRHTGFEESRFIPVDIRGADNDGILARLQAAIDTLIRNHPTAQPDGAWR